MQDTFILALQSGSVRVGPRLPPHESLYSATQQPHNPVVGLTIQHLSDGAPTRSARFEADKLRTSASLHRALTGGLSGAAAMGICVTGLCWLRTIQSVQQVYGTSIRDVIRRLYREGGIKRFYTGYTPALIGGVASRFGDTGANCAALSLMDNHHSTRDLPMVLKTAAGSIVSGLWRVMLTPLETLVVCLQIDGHQGRHNLHRKFEVCGARALFQGSSASFVAHCAGHWPWFVTFNACDEYLPQAHNLQEMVLRSALMGFSSSLASDVMSNSLLCIKTVKQASSSMITYRQAVRAIVQQGGLGQLMMGRGLSTKLVLNALQGTTFGVTWRLFDQCLFANGDGSSCLCNGSCLLG